MTAEKKSLHVPEEQVSNAEDVKTNAESKDGGVAGKAADPDEKEAAPVNNAAKTKPVTDEHDDSDDIPNEQVSFEDEDAALAASATDLDLGDEDEDEAADDEKNAENISGKSKQELVDMFARQLESKPIQQLRRDAETVKVAFYKLHHSEIEQKKKQFVENNGNLEDFVPDPDNEEIRLKELFAEYRKRRAEYLEGQEKAKEENLKIKLQIIEDLKELVNANETLNNTFNAFRDLQQRWRDTGIVPQAHVKELWETYNLHVENFYNYIKINKELRDLDLKRNYESKLQLCEASEALILEPSIVTAFRKLQDLHDQWREIGPVAIEHKESLWERFKEASSRINKQHQEYFETIKEEQRRNFELKAELCSKVEEISKEILTTRKEWSKASDDIIEIQKVWKTIGFAPQKDNTKVYERFRKACDNFFELKRAFYEQVKAEMDNNLQQKLEICIIAESLQDSDQWKKTTDELIALQKKWKDIGPVPRRHSDSVWRRFRAACDRFFERKTTHFSGIDSQYEENLVGKLALLQEMESADINEGGFEAIKDFQRRWNEIGFVPIKRKDEIQKRYKAAMDVMFGQLRSDEKNRNMDRFREKVSSMKGGDRRLKTERDKLYNKVKQLEADIALLENNIGFFSKSKNAEAMIRDVQAKIEKSRQEMEEAIEKVNLIDSQE